MPDAQDDDMTGRPAGTGAGTIGSSTGGPTQKYFLSLLTPVRDEESYLIEFINYYLIHGVDHFYFYDGIGINWVMFGDGHHKTRPDGGVIANYLYRQAGQHPYIKSVVKGMSLVGFFDNPHVATLCEGALYVDPRMNPIEGAYNEN